MVDQPATGRRRAIAALLSVLVGLGACSAPGGPSEPTGSPQAGGADPGVGAIPAAPRDPALAAQVPPEVAADGVLAFATTASDPPDEFTDSDGTTVVGSDVDLGTALAQKLGLRAEFRNIAFADLVPAVADGRAEVAMSSLTVNAERTRAVAMVGYYAAGVAVAVRAGDPDGIGGAGLCGRRVGVQSDTVEVADLVARSAACVAAGRPPVVAVTYPTQVEATLALTRGKVTAMVADSPAVAYAVKTTGGTLQVLGPPTAVAPYGIAVAKGRPGLARALQGAVRALIADGTYRTVLDKWGISVGAVTDSTITG